MKCRSIAFAVAGSVLVAVAILVGLRWNTGVRIGQGGRSGAEATNDPDLGAAPSSAKTNAPSSLKTADFPDDPRPGVRLLYDLARAARLYNFDPVVTGYLEKTNGSSHVIIFDTPTHTAEVINGSLLSVTSAMDSSNPFADTNHLAVRSWHLCTGSWSEAAALAETLAILERLNDTNTLAAVRKGRHELEAIPIRLPVPGGGRIRVTPFWRIALYDEHGNFWLRAEFRMGSNGPAGLTHWFHLH